MAPADTLIGTSVGDYRLTGVLGEGGMGIVYSAEHRTLGNRTACKVLRREVMDNPDAVARFLQEARLISRVRHRNLIDIFDAGELPDGRLYYVMEYLSGQPLSDRIRTQRLSFAEVLHITRQIGAGLQAAHGAGIVHRDLKPANIFLVAQPGAAPLVKVVDFGVAKVRTERARQLPFRTTARACSTDEPSRRHGGPDPAAAPGGAPGCARGMVLRRRQRGAKTEIDFTFFPAADRTSCVRSGG